MGILHHLYPFAGAGYRRVKAIYYKRLEKGLYEFSCIGSV